MSKNYDHILNNPPATLPTKENREFVSYYRKECMVPVVGDILTSSCCYGRANSSSSLVIEVSKNKKSFTTVDIKPKPENMPPRNTERVSFEGPRSEWTTEGSTKIQRNINITNNSGGWRSTSYSFKENPTYYETLWD